jgi:hypothetical protein
VLINGQYVKEGTMASNPVETIMYWIDKLHRYSKGLIQVCSGIFKCSNLNFLEQDLFYMLLQTFYQELLNYNTEAVMFNAKQFQQ